MSKETIKKDSLTISRYIKSCENLKQLKICDNILWNFCKKYEVKYSWLDALDIVHPPAHLSWFRMLCAQHAAKETNLLDISQ